MARIVGNALDLSAIIRWYRAYYFLDFLKDPLWGLRLICTSVDLLSQFLDI